MVSDPIYCLITRPSDNALVWKWDAVEPFGNNPANENPSGLGVFQMNLRHPGQYYDQEVNTFYNYNRDYDPATGRYRQSDPIGLRGGFNTYVYARSTPTTLVDPNGLKPGDKFESESLAAFDALFYFMGLERVNFIEYASVIYRTEDCEYSYTEPLTDFLPRSVRVRYQTSEIPEGASISADIHNHPRNSLLPGETGMYFSKNPDISGLDADGRTGYLITPNWMLVSYKPLKTKPLKPCVCKP